MPAAPAKATAQRKRVRKRKRRAASSSESSSSSDSSDDDAPQTTSNLEVTQTHSASESSSSSSSSSSESSDSDSDDEVRKPIVARGRREEKVPRETKPTRRTSPSPSPPPATLPSFLPSADSEKTQEDEKQLKERFRQFWMSPVVDGFQDDLEEIRKEPNLGTARLALLIDSLASGAEVFSSSNNSSANNEMDVLLN